MLHCFQTAKDIQYHLRKKVAELLISHLLEYVFLLLERVLEHCLEPIVAYPVESLVIETLFKVHTRRLVTVLNRSELILETDGHLSEIADDSRGKPVHCVHIGCAVLAEPERFVAYKRLLCTEVL